MKKTLGGKFGREGADPKTKDRLLPVPAGDPVAVIQEFTNQYSLVGASAQLNLLRLYAQGDMYHSINPSEQKRMNEFCDAMNDLLRAVFDMREESAAEQGEMQGGELPG